MSQEPEMIPDHPMTPSEASGLKRLVIPAFVFRAVNTVLAKEFNGRSATLRQCDVVKAIMDENPEVTKSELFDNRWMDFEPAYRAQGWKVEYDKPGYNESYEATYKFTKN